MVASVTYRDPPQRVTHPETRFPFPKADDVRAIVFESLYREDTKQDVAGQVAPEHWAELLGAMQPSQQDPDPVTWNVFGHMRIETKSEPPIFVMLSFPSSAGLAFRAGGEEWSSRKYYFGGDGTRIEAVLARIAATLPPLEK